MTKEDLYNLVARDVGVANLLQLKAMKDTFEALWNRLGGNDPHRAEVVNMTWTVAHPLTCRIQEGGLMACPVICNEPPSEGTFELVDGEWVRNYVSD